MSASLRLAVRLSVIGLVTTPVVVMGAPAPHLRFDAMEASSKPPRHEIRDRSDGETGCIRMCEQDTAPCDPPLYKHADGRCTYDN